MAARSAEPDQHDGQRRRLDFLDKARQTKASNPVRLAKAGKLSACSPMASTAASRANPINNMEAAGKTDSGNRMKNDSADDALEQRCKRYRIKKERVLEAYGTIKPILDAAALNVDLDAVIESREIMDVARKLRCNTAVLKLEGADVDYQNSNTWVDIFYKAEAMKLTEKEWLVFRAITYVVLAENVYNWIVSVLCYALVHRTVPPSLDKKLNCMTDFEDISSKVDLADKLRFLPGSCSELAGACNLNLRNSAAHMRFCLVPDMEQYNERHETATSNGWTAKIRVKKHDLYLFKKEHGRWKRLDDKPTDPKEELAKLMNAAHSWHTALLHYQAVKWLEEFPR